MSWLDGFFFGYSLCEQNGVPLPPRRIINVLGGITLQDDPAHQRTNWTGAGGSVMRAAVSTATYTVLSTLAQMIPVSVVSNSVTINANADSFDGQIIEIGHSSGDVTKNNWYFVDPAGLKVQNPQGPGLVFGTGGNPTLYAGDEPGTWHGWVRTADPVNGTYWASLY